MTKKYGLLCAIIQKASAAFFVSELLFISLNITLNRIYRCLWVAPDTSFRQ